MPPTFVAPLKRAGVDDSPTSIGMVIAKGGTNLVSLLDGGGLDIVTSPGLSFTELKHPALLTAEIARMWLGANAAWVPPRAGILAARTFKIQADGAALRKQWIQARDPRTKKPRQTLDVLALNKRRIPLAIRPVQYPDPKTGAPVFHSRATPFDFPLMVGIMNSIWGPQANVWFDLVSQDPFLITDADVGKALGLRSGAATLGDVVNIQSFQTLLAANKVGKAPTLFLVWKCADVPPNSRPPWDEVAGTSGDASKGVSLISDDRVNIQPEVMAHEVGHIIGDHIYRDGDGHPGWLPSDALMHRGGAADAKIFFREVEHLNSV